MRDFKGMKRQRGRNRGGGGGGKPQHNANRAFESNGPEGVKVRGAAQGVFEKYQQLARDAASAGDRVLAENYLQHAEHYFRTLRAMQPQRPAAEILGRDQFVSGFDLDFEAEPEEGDAQGEGDNNGNTNEGEGEERQRDERPREDRPREDRQRDERPRFDRPREDRQRDDRPRNNDRPREDRPRDDRPRDERPREDRPREDRPREERPAGEGRRDRWQRDDRPARDRFEKSERTDPLAVVEPQAAPLTTEAAGEGSPLLRGQDGAVSHAPAFLGRAPEPRADEAPAAEKAPRRRRAPKAAATEEV